MAKYELHVSPRDAAAFYEDGKLITVGHYDSTLERLAEYIGVEFVHDDAFMRGGSKWSDAASTLTAVNEFREKRARQVETAERLRAEAQALIEQARILEKQVGK